MAWGDARDQKRWQRELEAQLAALPTYEGDTPDGGPVDPVGRRLPAPPRPLRSAARPRVGRERRRTVVTVGVTLTIIVALLAVSTGPWAAAVRSLIGWEGDRGSTSSYAFLATQDLTGDPVTWSSCKPIEYVVNDAGAPDGWRTTLDRAVAAVSEASGLDFVDRGMSEDRDFGRRYDGNRAEPVLIGWATPEEVPALEGDVVGVAGPTTVTTVERGISSKRYETGSAVFDTEAFARMERDGDERLERSVVQHELGHLVGLDHVDDDKQLMYPTTTFQSTFGNGDLAGLAILGDGPCF